MKAAATALALAVALAVGASASAKEPLTAISICGADTCGEIRDADVLETFWRLLAPRPDALAAAPPLGAYYELRSVSERPQRFGYYFAGSDVVLWGWPGAALLWLSVAPAVRAELERATADVRPKPAPRPVRVVVNGRLVRDPAAYLPLYGPLSPAPRPRAMGPRWIPVTFVWNETNPWSEASSMFYDRDDRALYRGGEWYRLPQTLSRMITKPRLRGR